MIFIDNSARREAGGTLEIKQRSLELPNRHNEIGYINDLSSKRQLQNQIFYDSSRLQEQSVSGRSHSILNSSRHNSDHMLNFHKRLSDRLQHVR